MGATHEQLGNTSGTRVCLVSSVVSRVTSSEPCSCSCKRARKKDARNMCCCNPDEDPLGAHLLDAVLLCKARQQLRLLCCLRRLLCLQPLSLTQRSDGSCDRCQNQHTLTDLGTCQRRHTSNAPCDGHMLGTRCTLSTHMDTNEHPPDLPTLRTFSRSCAAVAAIISWRTRCARAALAAASCRQHVVKYLMNWLADCAEPRPLHQAAHGSWDSPPQQWLKQATTWYRIRLGGPRPARQHLSGWHTLRQAPAALVHEGFK